MPDTLDAIRQACETMGVDLPLFPSHSHLVCIGCEKAITGAAHDDDAGWLCEDCWKGVNDA